LTLQQAAAAQLHPRELFFAHLQRKAAIVGLGEVAGGKGAHGSFLWHSLSGFYTYASDMSLSAAALLLPVFAPVLRVQLGTHLRGKKKREELANVLRKQQKAAHK
jgi:hypothetical protein